MFRFSLSFFFLKKIKKNSPFFLFLFFFSAWCMHAFWMMKLNNLIGNWNDGQYSDLNHQLISPPKQRPNLCIWGSQLTWILHRMSHKKWTEKPGKSHRSKVVYSRNKNKNVVQFQVEICSVYLPNRNAGSSLILHINNSQKNLLHELYPSSKLGCRWCRHFIASIARQVRICGIQFLMELKDMPLEDWDGSNTPKDWHAFLISLKLAGIPGRIGVAGRGQTSSPLVTKF